MVAEVGVMGTEYAPSVESKKDGKGSTESERFRAKRAAMQARKHAQLNKLSTDYALEKQTLGNGGSESTESAEEVKKPRRKFRKAPELCENMTVSELAAVRSDVDDAIAFSSGISAKPFHCMDIVGDYELDCEANDYEVRRWDRHRKSRLSPKVRHLPDLSFTTKRKLGDATKMIGKKTFIKCDAMSRAKRTDEEMSYARERKAANVSKLLDRLGLKRRHDLKGFRRPEDCADANKTTTTNQKSESKDARSKKREREDTRKELRNARRKDWRKARWSEERKEERSRVPHEYELHVGNVECDDPEETDLLCFLLDLQNRDVTPEDYEMLLRLGEKIAPKTVADDKLESLRTVTVPSLSGDGASDVSWTDALCAVCMEGYVEEQVVKFLACEHFFHSHCIEMWLNNSGNTCPLDGLEV